jgi:recombination protein RecR
MLPASLQVLIDELGRLPGVGPRTAERYAFFILKAPQAQAEALAQAVASLHGSIKACQRCHNLAESDLCDICRDARRDPDLLAVVESPLDIVALERTGMFKGLYHVLGGVISPIDGIGPDQLNIKSLFNRLAKAKPQEVIIATNATTEGDATALYLQKHMPAKVKVTRLARGLPMGSDLEYADQITLGRALEGRRSF